MGADLLSGLPSFHIVPLLFATALLLIVLISLNTIVARCRPKELYLLWYMFFLSFCIMSMLNRAFLTGDQHSSPIEFLRGISIEFLKLAQDWRGEVMTIVGVLIIVVFPQIMSFIISGAFGCAVRPKLVSTITKVSIWSLIKFSSVFSGIFSANIMFDERIEDLAGAVYLLAMIIFVTMIPFLILMTYHTLHLYSTLITQESNRPWIQNFSRFMTRRVVEQGQLNWPGLSLTFCILMTALAIKLFLW